MMPLGFVWMVLKTSSRNVRWKLVINWWTDFKKGYYKFVDENVKDNVRHQPWSCHSRLLNVSSNKKHREWFDEMEQVIITQFGIPVGDIIRTTKGRQPVVDPLLKEVGIGKLLSIQRGRRQVEDGILTAASGKLAEFGIELLDIRFKRINYNESVRQKIYARMISERQQIAERFRSEGAGEAAKIIGNKEKELQQI